MSVDKGLFRQKRIPFKLSDSSLPPSFVYKGYVNANAWGLLDSVRESLLRI